MRMNSFIDSEVKSHDILVFMKGTPDFPQCGFSGQVAQIMTHLGADWKYMNVLSDDNLRQAVKDYTNWPTLPQVYVKGEFIGGCDILREMFQSGELKILLEKKGIVLSEKDSVSSSSL
ncbi:Grx4 family monothiol glutaredoxin [Candidatus Endowatersipora endosymbiont of Watersipora subatra]|uniref:Grx4 family monothiol glutaredoxin n=1 Tax=Candidatus Endowatersipora endosymbiont of Watersipora subatra TaxID=3077946 RepID=UPI00312C95C5